MISSPDKQPISFDSPGVANFRFWKASLIVVILEMPLATDIGWETVLCESTKVDESSEVALQDLPLV